MGKRKRTVVNKLSMRDSYRLMRWLDDHRSIIHDSYWTAKQTAVEVSDELEMSATPDHVRGRCKELGITLADARGGGGRSGASEQRVAQLEERVARLERLAARPKPEPKPAKRGAAKAGNGGKPTRKAALHGAELTPREEQLVSLVAAGVACTTADLARELDCSVGSVYQFAHSARKKGIRLRHQDERYVVTE